MTYPPLDEGRHRRVDRAVETGGNEDGWLVRGLVLSMRLFIVFFVAFARAVVIVSSDKIPDTLFDQAFASPTFGVPSSTDGSLSSINPVSFTNDHRLNPDRFFYVVFIGREVGYTRNNILMASLVQGIPNNKSQKFRTLDEAIRAYTEAVRHGNVRRVQTIIQPSGHVEYISEHINVSEGIRNLDAPHFPSHPLTCATLHPDPLPRTPCNTETFTDPLEDTATTSRSPVLSPEEDSDGLAMPTVQSVLNPCEAGADTVIISSATAFPTVSNKSASIPGSLTVIVLDSDDDSINSSVLANNSVSSLRSARSSDVYYTDKAYDLAFAAYIEEEDKSTNAAAVEADSPTAVDHVE